MMPFYAALVAAIALGVTGQVLLKQGAAADSFYEQLFQVPTIAGLSAYVMSAMLYMVALRQIPLTVAYPSVSASYILVVLVGMLFLGEVVTWQQGFGILLISVGVALLYA